MDMSSKHVHFYPEIGPTSPAEVQVCLNKGGLFISAGFVGLFINAQPLKKVRESYQSRTNNLLIPIGYIYGLVNKIFTRPFSLVVQKVVQIFNLLSPF
jgi:hypothetical protein